VIGRVSCGSSHCFTRLVAPYASLLESRWGMVHLQMLKILLWLRIQRRPQRSRVVQICCSGTSQVLFFTSKRFRTYSVKRTTLPSYILLCAVPHWMHDWWARRFWVSRPIIHESSFHRWLRSDWTDKHKMWLVKAKARQPPWELKRASVAQSI